ncbi:hypothetical protein V9T20_02280 [Halobacterium salinarum]|uniref:hypothetical protein n=1 Tax=Halobacterium salinarum TaxID=2242 RepID=UPI0030D50B89
MSKSAPTEWKKTGDRVYTHDTYNVKVEVIAAGKETGEFDVRFVDQGTNLKINNPQPSEDDAHSLASRAMEEFNDQYLQTLTEVESTEKSISLAVRNVLKKYRQ